jgi:hypothetical protein
MAKPAPPPPATLESDKSPAKSAPGGISGIIHKAKGHASNAGDWIKKHPVGAGAIGAGVAIGSVIAGWVIFRALKGKKNRDRGNARRHARSIDVYDDVKLEFPRTGIERRAVVEEIDWDDEEFLEFLAMFPEMEDLVDFEE